jgi:hypothetical protein
VKRSVATLLLLAGICDGVCVVATIYVGILLADKQSDWPTFIACLVAACGLGLIVLSIARRARKL